MMMTKSRILGILVGPLLVVAAAMGGATVSAQVPKADSATVKIWDAGKHHGSLWTAWSESFKNRASWEQVPYGKTDYTFKGDTVLENRFFYISLNANAQDTLNVRKGDKTLWGNIIYKTWYDLKEYRIEEVEGAVSKRYGARYGGGTKNVNILRNTPGELLVEHTGKGFPIVTTYRVLPDKPWVEVRPVKSATEQGIHGKVRMGLAPIEGGNDFVVDSLRDLPSRTPAPETRMLICFFEAGQSPFMWVITWSSPFEEATPWFLNDSGPKGDTMWWGGTPGYPRNSPGCITSSWAKFGKEGCVVVGGLTYWNNWHRDDTDRPIKKGQVYTSQWKPPYPGKWRMTARVAEKRYDQGFKYDGKTEFPAKYFSKEVSDSDFTFTSPMDGWLDYVIMYMYDRTDDTPPEILTPMDQYRWTMQQKHKQARK